MEAKPNTVALARCAVRAYKMRNALIATAGRLVALERDIKRAGEVDVVMTRALTNLRRAMEDLDARARDLECAAAVAALPEDATAADYHAACERFSTARRTI